MNISVSQRTRSKVHAALLYGKEDKFQEVCDWYDVINLEIQGFLIHGL